MGSEALRRKEMKHQKNDKPQEKLASRFSKGGAGNACSWGPGTSSGTGGYREHP